MSVNGSQHPDCHNCGGEGTRQEGGPCPACRGTGQGLYERGWRFRDGDPGNNGHAEQADTAARFAILLDGKRVAGGAIVLSATVAGDIQRALEDAEGAHRLLAPPSAPAAPEGDKNG